MSLAGFGAKLPQTTTLEKRPAELRGKLMIMRRHSPNLLLLWILSCVLSLGIGYGIFASGKAADCKPHEVDGQCGLSTFTGLIDGLGIGSTLFLVASACILFSAYKRRKDRDTPSL